MRIETILWHEVLEKDGEISWSVRVKNTNNYCLQSKKKR